MKEIASIPVRDRCHGRRIIERAVWNLEKLSCETMLVVELRVHVIPRPSGRRFVQPEYLVRVDIFELECGADCVKELVRDDP
jgi:hypothetical protein